MRLKRADLDLACSRYLSAIGAMSGPEPRRELVADGLMLGPMALFDTLRQATVDLERLLAVLPDGYEFRGRRYRLGSGKRGRRRIYGITAEDVAKGKRRKAGTQG